MKYCCDDMKDNCTFKCDTCSDKFECPDTLINHRKDGTFGIIVHDGGMSSISIAFCPWCGKNLQREQNDNLPDPTGQVG